MPITIESMNNYQDNLLRGEWQRLRDRIKLRDGYKCQNPNCKNTHPDPILQVHHKYYLGTKPTDCGDSMLITLCDVCHKEENNRYASERYLIQALKDDGWLNSDILALSVAIGINKPFAQSLLNKIRTFQSK